MHKTARLLAGSLVALLVASSCAGSGQDESVEVLAVAPEDAADDVSDRTDAPEIKEVGTDPTGSGDAPAPGDEAPEASSDSGAVDPAAVALAQAALDEFDGRAIRGEFYLEGALASAETLGTLAGATQFDTAADGDTALRLDAAAVSEILGTDLPAGTEIEVRVIGADAYVGIPAQLLQALGHDVFGDALWMVADDDFRAALVSTCEPAAYPDEMATVSPDATCDPLGGVTGELDLAAASSATIEGVEDLRGAAVTRVRVVVPIDALSGDDDPSAADVSGDEMSEAILDAFGASGGGVIYEFWIDEDGLARRIVSDLSSLMAAFVMMFGGELDDEVLLRVVVDIHGYDDVTVEAPPEELMLPEGVLSDLFGPMADDEPTSTTVTTQPPLPDPPTTSAP